MKPFGLDWCIPFGVMGAGWTLFQLKRAKAVVNLLQ